MIFSQQQAHQMVQTIGGVTRLLMGISLDGAGRLTPERLADLKNLSRALSKVRLRRLSNRLNELARRVGSREKTGSEAGRDVAVLLTDLVQTAKFIKTHLKGASSRSEVLGEIFECRWNERDLQVITDRVLAEMAITTEPLERTSRLDSRYLMDTRSGEVLVARTVHENPQSEDVLLPKAKTGLIHLLKGRVFPGFPPREVRLEDCAEVDEPMDQRSLNALLELAHESVARLTVHCAQLWRNFFAPPATFELVRTHALMAVRTDIYVMDPTGELLRIDRAGSPQGVRCVRLAERARLAAIFGRVCRDPDGRLTMAPLAVLALLKGLELIRL
ncbi:MAG: hypothetical protein HY815_03140 [Candidatus Riflebacteria bacterium]|nr:hypothetical protein [Candidatus Riflebacteria bacterium]